VSAEEVKGVELGEIAVAGLPAPGGETRGVGFVGGEAVPALEDLLAGVVVGWDSGGVSDPCSVGEIAGRVGFVESGKRVGYGRGGGGSELREKEEDGSEAEKREKRKERNFLLGALRVSFPCGHSSARRLNLLHPSASSFFFFHIFPSHSSSDEAKLIDKHY